ncbi:MAG: PKD domain-containing protein [Flavobacteriales bacterium]
MKKSIVLDLRFSGAFLLLVGMVLNGPSTCAQTVPSGFNDALVMNGFTAPVGFTFDANGRMYVWEKAGRVWIVQNGVKLSPALLDISEEVGDWRDHGFLGFTLDPDFLTNGRMYMLYTVDRHHLMNYGTGTGIYNAGTNQYYAATIMRITRYTAIGPNFNTVDYSSRFVLLGETRKTGVPLLHESHSTGQLVFGADGTLMATVGDGASYNATDVGNDGATYFSQALTDSIIRPAENVGAMRSQLLNCHNGKLLRLDPNTGNGVPSNPYYDPLQPRAPKSRVWAMGLRNPFRMTRRPGSGSTNPADGNPGVFYIGDVGWGTWEDLQVSTDPGQNFGWPIFEGLENNTSYAAALTPNLDMPNPLYGTGSCAQQYFNFQDLLKQDTPVHLNGHPNPCDAAVQVPVNVPHWFHSRPAIDWQHGNRSRCGGFSGNTAVTFDLDAVGSPVPGPRFGGNASVGGTWLTGIGWPIGYQNTYFNADYPGAWIKRFTFNADNKPVNVANFGSSMGAVVFVKEGPDGGLWYVRYDTGAIRKVMPIGVTNLPPAAVAQQNVQYGPGPLTVQFTGSNSTDPENAALTYIWNFGDGTTNSSLPNPQHTFTPLNGNPISYNVTLTVLDPSSAFNTATLIVSVNNTPPVVSITSFPDGHFYPLGVDTIYACAGTATDPEPNSLPLTHQWQTIFHHNNHVHPESPVTAVTTSTVISGLGCYTDDYWYEVKYTVTDVQGLSTTVVYDLQPRCSSIAPTAVIVSNVSAGQGPLAVNFNGGTSVDNGTIVSYAWDFGDGTTSTSSAPSKTFTSTGDHVVTLTVTDNDGLVGHASRMISVITFDPPQCVGAAGSILREYWTGIGSGVAVSDLTSNANYPNSPNGSSFPTSIQGPTNWGDNYGTRMRGYIIAPETGLYYFTVTSDDASILYLSLNAKPELKQQIASVPGWTNETEYTKYGTQRSAGVQLQAGVYYYFEFLQKEGGGGDHMAVRWERPSVPTRTIVAGAYLARWQDCSPSVKLRTVLQGAFDTNTGLMRDDLRAQGFIPSTEPFTGLGFTHAGGGGGETVSPGMLAVTGQNAIVDWVLVELRNKNNSAQVLATRSALLQRDGDIIGTDGYPRMLFNVASDNYFIAVRHRNHFGVMIGTSTLLNKDEKSIDFTLTTTATYGTQARTQLPNGKWAQWSGNVVRDNMLKYIGTNNDRDPILVGIGGLVPTNTAQGYQQTDINLDGSTKYIGTNNDRDLILVNLGGSLPTATKQEQLP